MSIGAEVIAVRIFRVKANGLGEHANRRLEVTFDVQFHGAGNQPASFPHRRVEIRGSRVSFRLKLKKLIARAYGRYFVRSTRCNDYSDKQRRE